MTSVEIRTFKQRCQNLSSGLKLSLEHIFQRYAAREIRIPSGCMAEWEQTRIRSHPNVTLSL